jgi:hypothetical protein
MKIVIAAFTAVFFVLPVSSAYSCTIGNVWCENHRQWKCEKCGSQTCPILTGRACARDDAPDSYAQLRQLVLGRTFAQRAPMSLANQ